jgi:CRP-like cAMP-binding protein
VQQGDAPGECCLVVEGFVCRYKVLGRGQRQIVSFHIPGDVPDFQSLHLKVMDHSVGALAPTLVAFIPHAAISELMRSHPRLAAAIWRDTLIDASIFREWLSSTGRRSAYERIAHLICEMFVKYQAVGLSRNGSFELPITQAEYGDALGLSTVHVNRSIQALRKQGLIVSKGSRTQILDWKGLKKGGRLRPEVSAHSAGRPSGLRLADAPRRRRAAASGRSAKELGKRLQPPTQANADWDSRAERCGGDHRDHPTCHSRRCDLQARSEPRRL